jgi:hypothetical protein
MRQESICKMKLFYAKGIERKARSVWDLSDGRTCSDSPTRTISEGFALLSGIDDYTIKHIKPRPYELCVFKSTNPIHSNFITHTIKKQKDNLTPNSIIKI